MFGGGGYVIECDGVEFVVDVVYVKVGIEE